MKRIGITILAVLLGLSLSACTDGGVVSSPSSSLPLQSELASAPQSLPEQSDLPSSQEPESNTDSSPAPETPSTTPQTPSSSEEPQGRQTVDVTIPEGFTLAQIGERLEANGVCTKQALLDIVNTYDFSYYPLVAGIAGSPSRCYLLEGYLYPSTYTFYVNMKPQDVVGKFLRAAEANITAADRARAAQLGMTVDELITLASVIEKEAGNPNEVANVSSVFHNRLAAGMRLQADATREYVNRYLTPDYAEAYNTYKCAALPAGPICNPGRRAINAALYPADTGYLYFATSSDSPPRYVYATTFEEHQQNLRDLGLL